MTILRQFFQIIGSNRADILIFIYLILASVIVLILTLNGTVNFYVLSNYKTHFCIIQQMNYIISLCSYNYSVFFLTF